MFVGARLKLSNERFASTSIPLWTIEPHLAEISRTPSRANRCIHLMPPRPVHAMRDLRRVRILRRAESAKRKSLKCTNKLAAHCRDSDEDGLELRDIDRSQLLICGSLRQSRCRSNDGQCHCWTALNVSDVVELLATTYPCSRNPSLSCFAQEKVN